MIQRALYNSSLVLIVGALSCACVVNRTLADPTLQIQSDSGRELGVSTDHGIVFLGRTARSGDIEITANFGDGPSVERSVIEPIGGGIYTAESEIRLPSVAMTFEEPRPGSTLLIAGRDRSGPWELTLKVQRDPRVTGILLKVPGRLRDRPDQIGAGVYVCPEGDRYRRRLVGLVSGRLVLTRDGRTREYMTVMGPRDLWRLVAHRRDQLKRRPWVYREDVL